MSFINKQCNCFTRSPSAFEVDEKLRWGFSKRRSNLRGYNMNIESAERRILKWFSSLNYKAREKLNSKN